MGIFDVFKSKEPHYDASDIRVVDLDVGFVFEYDMSTWEVVEMYEYDWGDNYFTHEYKITNGSKTFYLGVEEDDELEITLMSKIKVSKLGRDVISQLREDEEPPESFIYEGNEYVLESESPGYFNDMKSDDWEEFRSWDFEGPDNLIITIEQWGEGEFEAAVGKYIDEFEISNILPSNR